VDPGPEIRAPLTLDDIQPAHIAGSVSFVNWIAWTPTTYAAAPKISPTTPSSAATTNSTSAIVVAGPINAML